MPGPNLHDPQLVTSKEALGIELADTCGLAGNTGDGTTGAGRVGVSQVLLIHDYHAKATTYTRDGCVNTVQGELNKFQFRLSKSRIEGGVGRWNRHPPQDRRGGHRSHVHPRLRPSQPRSIQH